jgi:hypothetical protein
MQKPMPEMNIKKTIVIALVLFCLDVIILSSGLIAVLVLVVMVFKCLKLVLTKQTRFVQKPQMFVGGIYLLTILLIFEANTFNRRIAEDRASTLIMACENYKSHYNEYPKQLTDTVPEFIDTIPRAKYTLVANEFMYLSDDESHSLLYSVSPLGRRSYSFELHRWRND